MKRLLLGAAPDVPPRLRPRVVALNLRGEDPRTRCRRHRRRPARRRRAGRARRATWRWPATAPAATPRRGGAPYAGGRGIETPFGTVFACNLTPDRETGIGDWTAVAILARACTTAARATAACSIRPFPTRTTRASRARIRTRSTPTCAALPPARQPNTPPQPALPVRHAGRARGVARAVLPAGRASSPKPAQSAEWNRGAYLVNGLGHCNACHARRNAVRRHRRARSTSAAA